MVPGGGGGRGAGIIGQFGADRLTFWRCFLFYFLNPTLATSPSSNPSANHSVARFHLPPRPEIRGSGVLFQLTRRPSGCFDDVDFEDDQLIPHGLSHRESVVDGTAKMNKLFDRCLAREPSL